MYTAALTICSFVMLASLKSFHKCKQQASKFPHSSKSLHHPLLATHALAEHSKLPKVKKCLLLFKCIWFCTCDLRTARRQRTSHIRGHSAQTNPITLLPFFNNNKKNHRGLETNSTKCSSFHSLEINPFPYLSLSSSCFIYFYMHFTYSQSMYYNMHFASFHLHGSLFLSSSQSTSDTCCKGTHVICCCTCTVFQLNG